MVTLAHGNAVKALRPVLIPISFFGEGEKTPGSHEELALFYVAYGKPAISLAESATL